MSSNDVDMSLLMMAKKRKLVVVRRSPPFTGSKSQGQHMREDGYIISFPFYNPSVHVVVAVTTRYVKHAP